MSNQIISILQMGDFFQERKNNQYQFRQGIDKFIEQCESIQTQNQLDQATLLALFSSSKNEFIQGGKICLEKIYETIRNEEGGHVFSYSDFQSIFGPQKYLKVSEMVNLLRKFNLHSFDLKTQMTHHFFENKKMSMQKLDNMMKKLGYQQLNKKNKQMLIECFDFNSNKVIDFQDLNSLIQIKQTKN